MLELDRRTDRILRSAPATAGDPQFTEQQRQHRAVPGMTRTDDQGEQSTVAVDQGVGLGAQPPRERPMP